MTKIYKYAIICGSNLKTPTLPDSPGSDLWSRRQRGLLIMKEIVMLRHGRKDGELIAPDALEEIRRKGIPALDEYLSEIKNPRVRIHLGSDLERTYQTAMALGEHIINKRKEIVFRGYLFSDKRFGNQEMFKVFLADEKIKAEGLKSSWEEAFRLHNPGFMREVKQGMVDAMRRICALSDENDIIITVGHTPLIEWAAFACDVECQIPRNVKLDELCGFVFQETGKQENNGFKIIEVIRAKNIVAA